MKRYNNSWQAKKMQVNFNQKQWRQDVAAFIKDKKFWGQTSVTRSKLLDKKSGLKEFEVYSGYGLNVVIRYKGSNEIVNCSNNEIITNYFEERNFS